MTPYRSLLLLGLIHIFTLTGSAQAASDVSSASPSPLPLTQASRGAMLYDLHCNACHAKEVHWRTQKQVTDMSRLQHEVRRWNDTSEAHLNETDLREVTHYLNTTYYHFPTD